MGSSPRSVGDDDDQQAAPLEVPAGADAGAAGGGPAGKRRKVQERQQREGSRKGNGGCGRGGRGGGVVLESILRRHRGGGRKNGNDNDDGGGGLTVDQFFDGVWQKSCAVFRYSDHLTGSSRNRPGASSSGASSDGEANRKKDGGTATPSSGGDGDEGDSNPHRWLVENGWSVLVKLLERSREKLDEEDEALRHPASGGKGEEEEESGVDAVTSPMLFRDQRGVPPDEAASRYGGSFFAAYLDGCSAIVNHCDRLHGAVAALCDDLQSGGESQLRRFPFAYANAYVTPPCCQTVPPHADDRDVLVFQVFGRKHWKVYGRIPVPFPYPDEQVGKGRLEVPVHVLEGPLLIETVLEPGDVMYMPRGYVHEARSAPADGGCGDDGGESSSCSFHVTVALATHDWTLAGTMAGLLRQELLQVVDYRRAVLPSGGISGSCGSDTGKQGGDDGDITTATQRERKQHLQRQIDGAFEMMKSKVTAESVDAALSHRCGLHRDRVAGIRRGRVLQDCCNPLPATSTDDNGNRAKSGDEKRYGAAGAAAAVVGRKASELVQLDTRIRLATDAEKAAAVAEAQQNRKRQQQRGLNVSDSHHDAVAAMLAAFRRDPELRVAVRDFEEELLVVPVGGRELEKLCRLTLLSFARQCVELGALAIAA